ncbi:hypothetical protein RCO28_27655 [Streptomyces sp. LHD-70]|uniref:hypothetical protein n=1 Tax=Streptomyces sp. LHD-70 TaxID=3072140 RepID=UPI00280F0A59|nr:hypothetical protein [Streptomyces sp. LHD-70]MDQ8706217.1 hypothetical protein [Streptomyces sp. LHD-70]
MTPHQHGVYLARYVCPVCEGDPRPSDCLWCARQGTTDDIRGFEDQAGPLPRPPAVMPKPCRDCAFRPDSPEDEADQLQAIKTRDRVFHCHAGMEIIDGDYTPVATLNGIPVGYQVCAGWWAWLTGEPLPTEAYEQSAREKRAERERTGDA